MSALQMMGGRFRSVMPSNLVYPGACAIESLPAPGSEYASQAAKGELRRLFARCGKATLRRLLWLLRPWLGKSRLQ